MTNWHAGYTYNVSMSSKNPRAYTASLVEVDAPLRAPGALKDPKVDLGYSGTGGSTGVGIVPASTYSGVFATREEAAAWLQKELGPDLTWEEDVSRGRLDIVKRK